MTTPRGIATETATHIPQSAPRIAAARFSAIFMWAQIARVSADRNGDHVFQSIRPILLRNVSREFLPLM